MRGPFGTHEPAEAGAEYGDRSGKPPNSLRRIALLFRSVRPSSFRPTTSRFPRLVGEPALRLVTSLATATLLFAGAALSATAGDALIDAVEPAATTGETTTGTAPIPDEAAGATTTGTAPIPDEAAAAPRAVPVEPVASESPDGAGAQEIPPPVSVSGAEAPVIAPEEEPDPGQPRVPPAGTVGAAPAGGTLAASGGPVAEAPAPEPAHGGETPAAAPESHVQAGQTTTPPSATQAQADETERARSDREAKAFGPFAGVWLLGTLPDPTPPATRLAPAFARRLARESRRAGVDWALVLAALRAQGYHGRFPARPWQLRALATRLHGLLARGERHAFLALSGRRAIADRAIALTNYNRAVGLRALVAGLAAWKRRLQHTVLVDSRLDVYRAGRGDIAAGRIDVRVLAMLRYLAEAHGQVTVSSLRSGHRLFARPGVVSAHVYGLAADIASLGGSPILGNSHPGGVTEQGVRNLLLLPAELRPQQVISLLGLGGPSFPLANHADHIHVGY
jgi:hypothetical protein